MVDAQEWLNEKYPINRVCQRDNDFENKGKRRAKITELDISKGKIGNNFFSDGKTLTGSLKLEGFTSLETLIISSHELINLDISDCLNLKKLECNDNLIKNLKYPSLSSSKLVCLNAMNNNLSEQNLSIFSKFVNLESLWIGNDDKEKIKKNVYNRFTGSLEFLKELKKLESLHISNTDIGSGLEYLSKNLKEIYCEVKERPEADCKIIVINLKKELERARELTTNLQQNLPIKNIIIIGCTGSGKSALANVISGTDKFIESDSSISETKETQSEEFESNGIRYNIVDTVGFGDTKLPSEEVVRSISDAAYSDRNGLSQVLFVVKDRFDEQQRFAYNSLRNVIFGGDVDKYVTIVRTKFSKFEEKEKCEDDKQKMLEENPELTKIINSVNKVIHVDNQSIVEGRSEAYNKEARKLREKSRKKLLEHLEICQGAYQPRYLSRIKRKFEEQLEQSEKIRDFLKNDKIKNELEEWIFVLQGLKKRLEKQIVEKTIFKVDCFLVAKANFLNSREETIKELRQCFDELEKHNWRNSITNEVGNTISNVGGSISGIVTFGVPKIVGEAIKMGNSFSKIILSSKSSDQFQVILGSEESELTQLDNAYDLLVNVVCENKELEEIKRIVELLDLRIDSKKIKLFDNKYRIFDILTSDGIWEGRSLNSEKMEKTIISLSENLECLKSELEQEQKRFKEFSDNINNNRLEKNQQASIQQAQQWKR